MFSNSWEISVPISQKWMVYNGKAVRGKNNKQTVTLILNANKRIGLHDVYKKSETKLAISICETQILRNQAT